jgi:hypothetical protein
MRQAGANIANGGAGFCRRLAAGILCIVNPEMKPLKERKSQNGFETHFEYLSNESLAVTHMQNLQAFFFGYFAVSCSKFFNCLK